MYSEQQLSILHKIAQCYMNCPLNMQKCTQRVKQSINEFFFKTLHHTTIWTSGSCALGACFQKTQLVKKPFELSRLLQICRPPSWENRTRSVILCRMAGFACVFYLSLLRHPILFQHVQGLNGHFCNVPTRRANWTLHMFEDCVIA